MKIVKPFRVVSAVVIVLLLSKVNALAESVTRLDDKSFEGVIVVKGWAKSGESYCHGGAEYFVLEMGDSEITVGSDRSTEPRGASLDDLRKYKGHKVRITGALVTRTLSQKEHCPDPGMQCPSSSISCSYIDVKTIDKLDG